MALSDGYATHHRWRSTSLILAFIALPFHDKRSTTTEGTKGVVVVVVQI